MESEQDKPPSVKAQATESNASASFVSGQAWSRGHTQTQKNSEILPQTVVTPQSPRFAREGQTTVNFHLIVDENDKIVKPDNHKALSPIFSRMRYPRQGQ